MEGMTIVADPNQTPGPDRFQWACPCAGCSKAVAFERNELIKILVDQDVEYLKYRGSSFDMDGVLLWAKDDALAYHEGIQYAIQLIESRKPKPKPKRQ